MLHVPRRRPSRAPPSRPPTSPQGPARSSRGAGCEEGIPRKPPLPPLPTLRRRRPWRRRCRRQGRGVRSRLSFLAARRARLPASSHHPRLEVLVQPQGSVDCPLAGEGVGPALRLTQRAAVYLAGEIPDELPLQNGAPDGGDLVLGVGIE